MPPRALVAEEGVAAADRPDGVTGATPVELSCTEAMLEQTE
jgi:hypothetical protein